MDSSQVSSLTASFGQIKVDDSTCTGEGPINRLPNEMMQLIMAKLGVDSGVGDVRELFQMRLVSTRWNAVIEDYCRLKKSLCVNFYPNAVPHDCASYFEKTFFGFANSKNFICLFLSTYKTSECLSSLRKMFPNIEQLSIFCNYYDFHGRTLNDSLQVYIKSLDSLKLFDLNCSCIAQLSPALSKLEHFSYEFNSSAYGFKDELFQLIPHLGPGCVRANFGDYDPFAYDQVLQWHNMNPLWLANLTHLRVHIRGTSEECARVLHFLSEHAILLQHLDFNTQYRFVVLKLTPTVLEDLAKLTHLTYLALNLVELPNLEQPVVQHRLTSLTSVLTCKLWVYIDGAVPVPICGHQITRVLSVIFPNLVELHLSFKLFCVRRNVLRPEIEQHLERFSKLQKHTIEVKDYDYYYLL